MTALARAGWKAVTLEQFASSVQRADVPCNEFLLTFDDGYASLADNAYPVLADLGFTATTFVITDYVGQTNTWDMRYTWDRLQHLRWPEVEHWQARGFDFASHGATHRRLTWLDDAALVSELERSHDMLISRLGAGAGRAVAYPFGAADTRVVRHAQSAGYELGFGGVRGKGEPMHLSRVPVYFWDRGDVPFGLRSDGIGALGKLVAHAANRCAVGTSVMLKLMGSREWGVVPDGVTDGTSPHSPLP
jgi:peptidoglycan/xylan/chitin deacetylase (PgdA/CDA1 family)